MSFPNNTNRINRAALPKRAKGFSLIAVIALIAIVTLLGALAMSVGPSYYRYFAVTKIAKDVVNDQKLMASSKRDISAYIKQAYRTNDLWDFEVNDTVKLSKDSKGGYLVSIDYEERNKFLGNMDIVTNFKKVVEQP